MDGEEAVSQARHVGVRLYMGLDRRSLRWYTDDGKEVKCLGRGGRPAQHGARRPLHR
jgi:hypothetical protein